MIGSLYRGYFGKGSGWVARGHGLALLLDKRERGRFWSAYRQLWRSALLWPWRMLCE